MLPTRLPLRALVAASAVAGLGLAGLSPAPAQAAAPITDGNVYVGGSVNYDTGACTGAESPSSVQATFAAGSTVTRTVSFDESATATADATDSIRFKGSQTLRVAATGSGQLSTLAVSSTVTGSITATKPSSACLPDGYPASQQSMSGLSAVVHRTTPGWLHIQGSSVGTGGQVIEGELAGGSEGLVQVQFGGFAVRDLSHDQWIYVPPGAYELELALGGAAAVGNGVNFPSTSLKQSVKLTFAPAGVAKAATSGTARAKVLFPNVLTCSTGRASVRLTSKITGASRASLYVNGVRKTTIVRPRARTVTLTGVPKNRAVSLKLVVVDHGRTLTATRSYRSC
jgi:hypothetical protein